MELGGEFYLDLNALSEKHHSVEGYLSDEHPLYFDSREYRADAARCALPRGACAPERSFCRSASAIPSSPPFPATRRAFTG